MGVATFAKNVSPQVEAALAEASDLFYQARRDDALQRLRAAAGLLESGATGDDDRIALGELAAVIGIADGKSNGLANEFVVDLANRCGTPRARGALFFHRANSWGGTEEFEYLRRALAEFSRAGDDEGRAATLARMSWPSEDAISPEHRVRLGREAVRLAESTDVEWLIAYCMGKFAGAKMYLGDPSCFEDFPRLAERLVAVADAQTAQVSGLNHINWGLSAFAFGRYDEARRVFTEGRATFVGELWENRFDGGLALVAWRTGQATPPFSASSVGRELTSLARAAHELETARQPDPVLTNNLVSDIANSVQLRWLAAALQAQLRVVRGEPDPTRGLVGIAGEAVAIGARTGWEDAMMVLAEHDPVRAREALERVTGLWPDYPRAVASRQVCEALTSVAPDWGALVGAAAIFEALPEPVTAGRILALAAKAAPTVSDGNALRRRALDLFSKARADRSLATVLRDRSLHRGGSLPRIPEQLAGAPGGGLTAREREVAVLAAEGLTAQEIATQLSISIWTTRHHLQRVRAKFGGVPKRKLGALLAGTMEAEG